MGIDRLASFERSPGHLPELPTGNRGVKLLLAVCILFAIKFALYGWWITPFWEIPDEPGHVSYIEDLSQAKYPELGLSRMTAEASESWLGEGRSPGPNWIAQHPPVHYALAVPANAIAASLGADFDTRVRIMRLLTAIIAGAALLGLGMFLRTATGNDTLAISGAVFIGATPMFTHLASGVTHDPTVAATAAWCAYWCTRWLRTDSTRDVLLCALFAALCMGTKVTGIAMAVPLFGMIAARILLVTPGWTISRKIRMSSLVWLVMFLPICIWMARNMVIFDNPLPDARMLKTMNPKDIGFIEYMLKHPVWQNVFLNFIALVGWTGQSKGTINFVQAVGLTAQFFTGAILLFSACSLARITPWFNTPKPFHLLLATAAIVVAVLATTSTAHAFATQVSFVLFLLVAASIGSNFLPALRGDDKAWLALTSAVVALAFGLLYYRHTWSSYLEFGAARALHGRYFYAVLPFIGYLMLRKFALGKGPLIAAATAAAALLVSEFFFLRHVFPMYGQI